VWQALRDELHAKAKGKFELVTVGLDALGNEGCQLFMEAALPTHPALLDRHHQLAEKFGVINIPSSVWIDENGMIVRPAEAAPAPPKPAQAPPEAPDLSAAPERLKAMMLEAAKIPSNPETYHNALRDWVEKGADSDFAHTPEEVIERSQPRSVHFELATALQIAGHETLAIEHFRAAHKLVPDSWTFRRQAWSLQPVGDGPFARFWQGPSPDAPDRWPYEGGWLEDVQKEGAENYSAAFVP